MEFEAFSAAHVAAMAACAAAVAAIVVFRGRLRRPGASKAVAYTIAAVLAASELSLQASYFLTDSWAFGSLPLQLCSMMVFLSCATLLTSSYRLYEITFFLGILGALQAMLTPALDETFPQFRYFHFFIAHIAIIAANVFMTAVTGFRPTVRSVVRALVWLNLLAIPAGIVNAWKGTNFMFLARKPATGSLLDLLAPWPWYILQLEVVAAAFCFLLLGVVRLADFVFGRREAASGS